MRILIVGGTGFIGSAINARLSAEGHECVTAARHTTAQSGAGRLQIDLAQINADNWKAMVKGFDVGINVAGALHGQNMHGVHVSGNDALYAACESEGVQRVVHFSAIGTDRDTPSVFSRTKREGEVTLTRDLNWVILRPSVVIGRSAYGGKRPVAGPRIVAIAASYARYRRYPAGAS